MFYSILIAKYYSKVSEVSKFSKMNSLTHFISATTLIYSMSFFTMIL